MRSGARSISREAAAEPTRSTAPLDPTLLDEAERPGVPVTAGVLEAMNGFAVSGALTALLAVTAAALAYHGTAARSALWLGLAALSLVGAIVEFVPARARLRATLIDACLGAGLDEHEARRRAAHTIRRLPRR